MEYGVTMFVTDYSIGAAEMAVAVEERGLDAFYVPDHTHIPADRESQFARGGKLPQDYIRNLDMFATLTAAAAVTKHIRLGTGICLVVERDPIITAKQIASLDHISRGRVDFGIGGGWNREEMENHGTPWNRRWKIVRERIEAMQAIWTEEEASYEGEFVNFERIWSWPKPVQKPHPPILIGGDAPGTFKRVLRYGDGWFPSLGGNEAPEELKLDRMAELQVLAKDAGRAPMPIVTNATPRDHAAIDKLREAGVVRCLFGVKSAPADEVLPRLDRLVRFLGL
jgi:probable F420-dependent oxidoreductase